MNKTVLALLTAAVTSGCSTTPIPASQAIEAPLDRVLAYQERTALTTATIVVTRDVGWSGSACLLALSIDKVLAARLDTGETARFFVEPGERLLRISQDPGGKGLCAIPVEFGATRETVVRANETKYFRMMLDQSGTFDIQRTD